MKTPSELFWEQKERMRQSAKERARGPEFFRPYWETKEGNWERSDAASLLIAWLVATDRCTMDDLKAGLKVFQKIGNCTISAQNRGIDFGPGDFVGAVMYEAKKEMEGKQ